MTHHGKHGKHGKHGEHGEHGEHGGKAGERIAEIGARVPMRRPVAFRRECLSGAFFFPFPGTRCVRVVKSVIYSEIVLNSAHSLSGISK